MQDTFPSCCEYESYLPKLWVAAESSYLAKRKRCSVPSDVVSPCASTKPREADCADTPKK
jgi:hypothetical protein